MKLKELRQQKRLTQQELAKEIQTSQVNYNRYEMGKIKPDIDTLCKIADFYGVSLDYLCDHKTNTLTDYGPLNTTQKKAISILLRLPESEFYKFCGKLETLAELYNINY